MRTNVRSCASCGVFRARMKAELRGAGKAGRRRDAARDHDGGPRSDPPAPDRTGGAVLARHPAKMVTTDRTAVLAMGRERAAHEVPRTRAARAVSPSRVTQWPRSRKTSGEDRVDRTRTQRCA